MIVISLYIFIGFIEYIRLSNEFRERLRDDFPYHSHLLIEFSLVIVLVLFGVPLAFVKTFLHIKTFFKNIWKKIIFPFKLRKFAKKLEEVSDEKSRKKSADMLLDAMKEVMR